MRKQAIAPRIGGKIRQPIHYFKRHCAGPIITVPAFTSAVYGALFIEPLTDIPAWTEFSNLFDSYKLMALKVMFIPLADNTTSIGNETVYFNRIFSCIDYNDRSVPTTISEVREYENCKFSPGNRIHKRYFKPNFTIDMENTIGQGTSSNSQKAWLNTNNAGDVEHFGLKYAIETLGSTASYTLYKVEYKVYLAFKSVR